MRPNKNTKKILVWCFWKPGNVPYLLPWGCHDGIISKVSAFPCGCLFWYISGPTDASRIITLKHHSLSKVPFSWIFVTKKNSRCKYNYDKECIQHGANVLKMSGTFKRSTRRHLHQLLKRKRDVHTSKQSTRHQGPKSFSESQIKQLVFCLQKFRLLDNMLDTCPCFILYFPHVNSEIWSFVLLGWGLVASKLWHFTQGVPMVLSRDNPGNTWLKQAKILEQMVLYQRLCLEFDHVGTVNFLCSAKKFFIYCKGSKVYDVDSFLGAVAYIVEYGYVDQGVLEDSFTWIDTLILTY